MTSEKHLASSKAVMHGSIPLLKRSSDYNSEHQQIAGTTVFSEQQKSINSMAMSFLGAPLKIGVYTEILTRNPFRNTPKKSERNSSTKTQ